MKRFKLTSNPSSIASESLLRSSRSPSPSLSSSTSSIRCFASQPRRTRPGASATDSTDLGRHFYLNKVLEQWAARPATRMTLRQLVFFGKTLGRDRDKILKSANYVRQELPIRIAHRIRDLQALPFVIMSNKHLEEVYNKYWHAFETFRKLPIIKNMEENEKFCELLKELLEDHLTIIPSLTIGIVESSNHLPSEQLDGFMERMLRSRISRRVLAEQHISLSDALDDPFHFFNDPSPPPSHSSIGSSNDGVGDNNSSQGDLASINHLDSDLDIGDHVGIIYTHLSVASVVRKGVKLLTEMFKEELIGDHNGLTREEAEKCIPEIVLDGDLGARFAYIPEHLEYIIFELLKNAMRATMKRDYKLWDQIPIRVTIVEGPPDEDVIIRISDSGGGLPDLVSKLQGPSAASNPATMMTRHSSHSPLTGALPNTITQTSSTSAGAVGLPASEVQAASLNAAIASTEPSSPSTGISPSSSSGSGTVPTSPSDALKLAAAPTGPTREFDFELDHSDQAFYGSDGSAGAPISPHQAAPSDSSFLTQWPFTPTPVGPQVNNDPLVDVLCSFSNVRRRLEIEERDRLMSIFEEGDMDANEESKSETGSKSKSNNNYEARKSWWNGNLVRDNEVGLGSRDRMDALRNVGTFKGTVKEQVLPSQRIPVPKSSQSSNPSQAETSINPSSPISSLPSSSSSNSNARSNRETFNLGPTDGTGPMALRNLKAETGLGLPMTKVYCDFFGGSLSFRSLDGHSTDVYVRLPKLGTKKETIEEIVL